MTWPFCAVGTIQQRGLLIGEFKLFFFWKESLFYNIQINLINGSIGRKAY